MQIVKSLLYLNQSETYQLPVKIFNVVVPAAEGFQIVIMKREKYGRFQQLNGAPVWLPGDETNDRAGKRIFIADPVSDIFTISQIVGSC